LCGGVGVNGIYGLVVLENDMYAVIRSGGKQHRVKEGDTLQVEKLELETGSKFNFDEVLLVGEAEKLNIGAPLVKGSKVTGEVVSHGRAKKINILKFKRRKHHMKNMGHRQWFTEVKITGIKVTAPKKAAVKAEKAEIEE
jgi:large subunit ribosomal protein L21